MYKRKVNICGSLCCVRTLCEQHDQQKSVYLADVNSWQLVNSQTDLHTVVISNYDQYVKNG